MQEKYINYLNYLNQVGLYRKLSPLSSTKEYVDFSSNDYLALNKDSSFLDSIIDEVKKYPIGATGSRILSGNKEIIESLENQIAIDKNTASALVFSSGFQANLSAISCLLDQKVLKEKPIVFFDKLNHASLYQGVFLSQPELIRYPHLDLKKLEDLLEKYKKDPRPKFIVSETLFGMDGDILPIESIAKLAKEYKAFLYLDEAHATGIMGEKGYGVSTTFSLKDIPHLIMGTFSKALGCSGGYIACSDIIKKYLINKAQGFIYSTALSPFLAAVIYKSWLLIKELDPQRKAIFDLSNYLRKNLVDLGFTTGNSMTHIIPILFNKQEEAFRAYQKILKSKIKLSFIRPPTVPKARLRIALNASHNLEDINRLISSLKDL